MNNENQNEKHNLKKEEFTLQGVENLTVEFQTCRTPRAREECIFLWRTKGSKLWNSQSPDECFFEITHCDNSVMH